jgi:sugar lactone lactonase YvrE
MVGLLALTGNAARLPAAPDGRFCDARARAGPGFARPPPHRVVRAASVPQPDSPPARFHRGTPLRCGIVRSPPTAMSRFTPLPALEFTPLPAPPSGTGESPFWHPRERALYWVDIPGRQLHRFAVQTGEHRAWTFEAEPSCAAPRPDGGLVAGFRDGIFHFDPATGARRRIAAPPYDPKMLRFNDGKADPQGRFWLGTIHEERQPRGSLYCLTLDALDRIFDDVANSNGLAWSPDGRTMYWTETKLATIFAFDFEPQGGTLSRRRVFASFPPKPADGSLAGYGGRPDGGAVDSEGCYWAACFEGQRLARFAPDGTLLQSIPLPVRCPTMPCFGGDDLRTLYVTTAREKRPEAELAAQPWAGRVLQCRVPVPGLPTNFADV